MGSAVIATFTYDGDGRRVKSVIGSATTVFVGDHYEVTGSAVTKYYFAGSQRLAMRTGGGLTYLFGDQLGSTSVAYRLNDGQTIWQLYRPWGEVRYSSGSLPTQYQYTGQYTYAADFGLYFYNARWYDSQLGRFNQADSIVPNTGDPQAWDRYAYVNNNAVKFVDPTGHMLAEGTGGGGIDGLKICKIKDYGIPPNQIRSNTNAILLKGGAGSGSYNAAAEDSYTGFSTSGASPKTGWADIPDLGNFVAAWVRDNTNVRDLWSIPEVQGQVYSQVTNNGLLTITGASITNNSFEDVGISFIYADTYSRFGDVMLSSQKLYPYNKQSIVTPDFGIAHPGTSSGVVSLTSSPIYSSQYLNVTIRVKTPSERYGEIGTRIMFNP